jgi:hypothetical protein
MAEAVEKGDIYFFYRPQVDENRAKSRSEVQRFYLILLPGENKQGRLFIVGGKRKPEIVDLPDKTCRYAAEVARAFGALRTHEKKSDHQPSQRGGRHAMQSPSAAKIASLFAGIDSPVSHVRLKEYAKDKADSEEMKIIKKFGAHTYYNMADVTKEVGKIM